MNPQPKRLVESGVQKINCVLYPSLKSIRTSQSRGGALKLANLPQIDTISDEVMDAKEGEVLCTLRKTSFFPDGRARVFSSVNGIRPRESSRLRGLMRILQNPDVSDVRKHKAFEDAIM